MIHKIDVSSAEFKAEKEKTTLFVEKVHTKKSWVYHPESKVNESVLVGLTRNQMIYGTRYCPCFVVEGDTPEERRANNNRICPCRPAVTEEISTDGRCHCGIYCTPDFAAALQVETSAEVVAHTHSRGLTKAECQALLLEDTIDSDDLTALLEARTLGFVQFALIDVREWNEWVEKRIAGTDHLVPTTSFHESISSVTEKDIPVVVYCFSGSRSRYCQRAMKDLGFAQVVNLKRGIMSWHGEIKEGEEQ